MRALEKWIWEGWFGVSQRGRDVARGVIVLNIDCTEEIEFSEFFARGAVYILLWRERGTARNINNLPGILLCMECTCIVNIKLQLFYVPIENLLRAALKITPCIRKYIASYKVNKWMKFNILSTSYRIETLDSCHFLLPMSNHQKKKERLKNFHREIQETPQWFTSPW